MYNFYIYCKYAYVMHTRHKIWAQPLPPPLHQLRGKDANQDQCSSLWKLCSVTLARVNAKLPPSQDYSVLSAIADFQFFLCAYPQRMYYIYRVPQCMSPRRNWDSPTPSLASECATPPGSGGAHSPAGDGLGESQFRRLRKSLALCLLCARTLSNKEKLGEGGGG